MKCAIFLADDFSTEDSRKNTKIGFGSGKTWYDYGRNMLHSYASRMDIPIVNVTFQHDLYKKFYEIFDAVAPDYLRKRIDNHTQTTYHFILKMMREYAFLDSDYDYAFFCDLDYILTNPELNIKDLVEQDTIYFNAYNHAGDGRLVDLKCIIQPHGWKYWENSHNEWCAGFKNRYDLIRHFGFNQKYLDLIAPTTGFHCYSKETGNKLINFYNEKLINPMTYYGMKNIIDMGAFPMMFDEEYLTWAINSGNFKFQYANAGGLVDERYFHNEKPCVFWHGPQFFDHKPSNFSLKTHNSWEYR